MWEDVDLAEKIEGGGIEEDSGLGGPCWSRSIDTVYEEEGGCIFDATPLAVDTRAVNLAGVKVKRPGVFMKVLRYSRRFSEAGSDYHI